LCHGGIGFVMTDSALLVEFSVLVLRRAIAMQNPVIQTTDTQVQVQTHDDYVIAVSLHPRQQE